MVLPAKYQQNGVELETAVVGSVNGKINAVRVAIRDRDKYAIYVDNNSGTVGPIFLTTVEANTFTLDDVPRGIYEIKAVRLDGQPDECGNKKRYRQ